MKENIAEEYARLVLEAHEFLVTRLKPPENNRCADFLVEKDNESFLLEVTTKKETEFFNTLIQKTKDEKVATGSRTISYSNRIDGILRDKEDQLRQTPTDYNIPKVLCISALNIDSGYIFELVKITLYGINTLSALSSTGEFYLKECYYHNYSAFYKYNGIDAVILASDTGGRILLNEFSQHYTFIKDSKLVEMFPEKSRIDPIEMEGNGDIFSYKGNVPQKNSKFVWQYLYDKYNVKTSKAISSNFKGLVSFDIGK